ncbi:hypothetical protein [Aerococcus urinaeequi]|nr:hypothetical protein [Aerococcus urinaeequi]
MLYIDWPTAKKYTDNNIWPEIHNVQKSNMMHDEECGNIVSLRLDADYRLPKKKHRTNKNHFESLKFLGFLGSYRPVCNFIHVWKSIHHYDLPSTGCECLEHPPAEAQLDFGKMEVDKKCSQGC